jgi:hypothetical protein
MLRKEAGQIVPGLLVLLVAILVLGLLAFQIGKAAVLRSGAQTGADAAALAGARNIRDQLIEQVEATGTADFARVNPIRVRLAAEDYARRNGVRLTNFTMLGPDVRAWAETKEKVDPPDVDRKGSARARARVELGVQGLGMGTGALGGGSTGGGGDTSISGDEWKQLAKELNDPPGCDDLYMLGRFLQEHGGQTIENTRLGFPPMAPGGERNTTSYHYRCGNSGAIDLSYAANEKAIIDGIIDDLQGLGFRTIWQVDNHFDHVHIDISNTPSIAPGSGLGGLLGAAGPLQDAFLQVKLVDWNALSPGGFAAGFVGGAGGIPFGPPNPQVAATMCQVLDSMNASDKVRTAAWETAIVESGVKNLSWGDRDSQGVFQQRPSQGWGSSAQVQDPEYATAEFVRRAQRIEGRFSDPGALAQEVQNSGHPERYAQRAGQAAALDRKFCGGG